MNSIKTATVDWFRGIGAAWNRFWFAPAEPQTYCLIRVLAGAMLLYTHAVWTLRLGEFFGSGGWLNGGGIELYHEESHRWSHFLWFDSAAWVWGTHLVALAVFFLLMVGYKTRFMAVLAWLFTISYVHRSPASSFGLDQINQLLSMYLIIGPAGACYSVDRWLARRRGHTDRPLSSVGANIGIRLIQLHMCVIYMAAGLSKLKGPSWWDGSALWLAFANYEYQSMDMTWLAHHEYLVNLMTHVTIFWEVFYCALVWPRLTRPIILFLAVPLHLGIAFCMGMITFGLIMLVGNLAFVSPRFVAAVIEGRWWSGRRQAPAAAPAEPAEPAARTPRKSQKRRSRRVESVAQAQ